MAIITKQCNDAEIEFAERYKNYKEIFLKLVKINRLLLNYASRNLKNDREVVLAAVKKNGLALEFTHNGFKRDKEIIFEALNI